MSMITRTIRAKGMHCSGCEHIIEDSVRKLAGVDWIKADYPSETAEVAFDPAATSLEEICAAAGQKGYRCAPFADAPPPRSHPLKKIAGFILGATGIFLIIFLDAKLISAGGAPDVSQHMGFGLILTLGLLTGFHCVGMCGGFVLSYTADDARLGRSSHLSHVLYGAGKTLSYTVIGGLFGLLGAVIAFTPMLRGVAGVGAGIFLIIFGLNMLSLFPALRKIRLRLPASLAWAISGQQTRSRNRPFVIGLLNGLMIACGPLQAMYVMAAGTGSAVEGAKMLFTFGVGTLPVLLSFGFLTSLISGALTHQLLRASGAVLILLGAVMINRGLILTGAGYDLQSLMTSASGQLGWGQEPPAPSAVGAVQTIRMDVVKSGFEPNQFVLRQGVPVKWVIEGKEITQCNKRIVVPKLGLEFDVKEGAQTIEFTPAEAGVIPWSCWMGMLHGQFQIVADPRPASPPTIAAPEAKPVAKPVIEPVAEPAATSPPADADEPSIATQEPAAPAEPPAPTATYKVTAGDTLIKIARKSYGDGRKWREIAKANPHLDAKKLKVGQIILLPRLESHP
jgi:sulfite exporter TauE/SafE/copper chaperone CopZ